MKTVITREARNAWVQTLATGREDENLFSLSPSLAIKLIPGEIADTRRDLAHCDDRRIVWSTNDANHGLPGGGGA